MSEDRGRLRISNADRDEAVARLQQSLDEGRLDLSEFDERARSAYGAKTRAELDLVFEDLPADRTGDVAVPADGPASAEPPATLAERVRRSVPSSFHPLIVVGSITTAIWLVSSISSGELQNFWPAWPIGIMAAIGVATWITGGGGGCDDEDDDSGSDSDRDDKR